MPLLSSRRGRRNVVIGRGKNAALQLSLPAPRRPAIERLVAGAGEMRHQAAPCPARFGYRRATMGEVRVPDQHIPGLGKEAGARLAVPRGVVMQALQKAVVLFGVRFHPLAVAAEEEI